MVGQVSRTRPRPPLRPYPRRPQPTPPVAPGRAGLGEEGVRVDLHQAGGREAAGAGGRGSVAGGSGGRPQALALTLYSPNNKTPPAAAHVSRNSMARRWARALARVVLPEEGKGDERERRNRPGRGNAPQRRRLGSAGPLYCAQTPPTLAHRCPGAHAAGPRGSSQRERRRLAPRQTPGRLARTAAAGPKGRNEDKERECGRGGGRRRTAQRSAARRGRHGPSAPFFSARSLRPGAMCRASHRPSYATAGSSISWQLEGSLEGWQGR